MRSTSSAISAYETAGYSSSSSRWNPANWTRRIWLAVGTVVVLIVVVVVGAVVGVKATRDNGDGGNSIYPDYFKLNYTLIDTYSGTTFFDKFNYFHTWDPAGGFVHYVDPDYAATFNLTWATSSTALIRVDTTVGPGSQPDASTGRFSVRLESKAQYGPGLFLFDVKHTPYGCATWPALWLTDPNNWPHNGEIDVLEAVNQATTGGLAALHTAPDCTMADVRRNMTGKAEHAACDDALSGSNTGCVVRGGAAAYGPEFNKAGGGIVALEWRDEGIRVWVFPRGRGGGDTTTPAAGLTALPDIEADETPDPSTWGPPLADFPATGCDIASHFRNQSIIINIDLCGYLTEAMWEESGCSHLTCPEFVANNPSAFTNAYWEFGAFQVYKAK
ncbi:hypothetical protein VTH82DRAFT_5626 [Thermothelomyces myriococcoides]